MAGILFIYFSPQLLHLNTTMFAATGDGLKNFYTLAYYVKYDSGFWFTGMLYPYGEHVSFTDNQPLTALVLNFIQHHLFDIGPYLLGIVNTLMLLNFFFCTFLLYKILRHLNLPGIYSSICAVLITLISPNFSRIIGHYSLSYCFLIPLIIYLVIQYESSKKSKQIAFAFLLLVVSFLSGLLHPYWVIITAMMLVLYALFKSIAERKVAVLLFIAGLCSPLGFKILLFLTDPVTDRPQDPYGAAEYAAWLTSIFFPQFEAYENLRQTLDLRKDEGEAIAYVGILGTLFVLFLAVKFILKTFRRRKPALHFLPGPPVLKNLFYTGIVILMLAMFIPFHYGMEDLFYRIPFLNQFRSLGRFAWAFYFIFCIYYAYGFWILLRRIHISKGMIATCAAVFVLFAIWLSDLHFSLSKVKKDLVAYSGENVVTDDLRVADLLSTSGYKPSDFQAILPLPIVAEGSEKLWLSGGWLSRNISLPYSYQTGTPVIGCIMSRTSLSRTLNFVNLTSSDYSEKKVLSEFKSNLPLLVVAKAGDYLGHLTSKCREIARKDDLALYILPLDSLRKLKTVDAGFRAIVPRLFISKDGYFINEPSGNILYWRNGSMNPVLNTGDKTFDTKEFKVQVSAADEIYSLSCWIKITPFGNKVPYFRYSEFDSLGNMRREKFTNANRNEFDVFEDWILFEDTIHLNPSTKEVELEIIGKESIVDHFLFKPENATVVVLSDIPGKIYINNFLVTLKN